MESSSSSLVSKARTAFHSAAAKAEKVLTDIKTDFKNEVLRERGSDGESHNPSEQEIHRGVASIHVEGECHHAVKHSRWRSRHLGQKQVCRHCLKNMKKGKEEMEETEGAEISSSALTSVPDEDSNKMDQGNIFEGKGSERGSTSGEDGSNASNLCLPPASIIKQLALAIELGKKFKSVTDILSSARDSERPGLSFSVVKSLVLRDKEDKATASESGDNEEVVSLIRSLFNTEELPSRKYGFVLKKVTATNLPRDIHGAPPDSFVVQLAETMGNFKSLRRMASFWRRVVVEIRRLWFEGHPVPCVPLDEIPDLNYCLLHQQLQVFNCCIGRKERRETAIESLESVMQESNTEIIVSIDSLMTSSPCSVIYARTGNGDLVLRLGAAHQSENLTLLETGEPVYSPVTQESPLLTEDLIRENEEFVLRTGSVGAGCSQLLSDMQAFKAANPGCILEDFIRWHSPPDWTEIDLSDEIKDPCDEGDFPSKRGQLSSRMQKEGNLWRELWETSKPLPAVKQAPLYDEDLAVEGILNALEDILPSDLFEQLFVSMLSSGFVIAESALPTTSDLSKLFQDCKEYVIAMCQGDLSSGIFDDLCQVYETVETIIVRPEEALVIMKQAEEATADEPKRRFGKFSLNFSGKDKQFFRKSTTAKDQKKSDENQKRVFSNLFDGKSSLFSKPQLKTPTDSEVELPYIDENDWTII